VKEKIAFSILNVFLSTKSQKEEVWVTAEAVFQTYSSFLIPLLDELLLTGDSRKQFIYSDVAALGKGFFKSSPFFLEHPLFRIKYHTGRNSRTVVGGKQALVLGGTELVKVPEDTLRNLSTTVTDLLRSELNRHGVKRPIDVIETTQSSPPRKRRMKDVERGSLLGEITEIKDVLKTLLGRLDEIEKAVHLEDNIELIDKCDENDEFSEDMQIDIADEEREENVKEVSKRDEDSSLQMRSVDEKEEKKEVDKRDEDSLLEEEKNEVDRRNEDSSLEEKKKKDVEKRDEDPSLQMRSIDGKEEKTKEVEKRDEDSSLEEEKKKEVVKRDEDPSLQMRSIDGKEEKTKEVEKRDEDSSLEEEKKKEVDKRDEDPSLQMRSIDGKEEKTKEVEKRDEDPSLQMRSIDAKEEKTEEVDKRGEVSLVQMNSIDEKEKKKKKVKRNYQSVGELYSGKQDEGGKMTAKAVKDMTIFVDSYLQEAEEYDSLFRSCSRDKGENTSLCENYDDEDSNWDEESQELLSLYCRELRDAVVEHDEKAKAIVEKKFNDLNIPRSYEFPIFLFPYHATEIVHEVISKISQRNTMLSNHAINIVMRLFVLWEAYLMLGARKVLSSPVISSDVVISRPWYKFMPASLEEVMFIFFPVYHRKHFALFVFSVENLKLKFYNSLNKVLDDHYLNLGSSILRSLTERYGVGIDLEITESAQQFGCSECGE
tara:strand:- start:1440 stop:3566 length:2127 start_codon:yes stop_codon:yes gene_type:complete